MLWEMVPEEKRGRWWAIQNTFQVIDLVAPILGALMWEQGLAPYQPQKLYYHTFPRTLLKLLVRVLAFFGGDPQHYGRNKDIDLLDLTETEYPIHARVNYRPVVKLKETASACHHSQLDQGSRSPLRILSRVLGTTETFMRAYPPADDSVKETDLFEGVDQSQ